VILTKNLVGFGDENRDRPREKKVKYKEHLFSSESRMIQDVAVFKRMHWEAVLRCRLVQAFSSISFHACGRVPRLK